ncbi:Herpes BLLF1 multi-domain protein [Pyrenophora teres f. maculata]|nr:Herpes BLLF1 multi-domain protein [Pyrenophora teres f. maculata]
MLRLFQDSREDSNTDAAMITRHRMHALLTLWIYGFKRHYNHDIGKYPYFLRCVELLPLRDAENLKESLEAYIGDLTAFNCRYRDMCVRREDFTTPIWTSSEGTELGCLAIFGMSQERKWKESYRGPQPVCLLALFRYPVHVQCALDIISGCIDAIVKQILQLSLEGKRLTITEIVDLAEDLSELILKHGPVALKSEAMMLVYPTFLREGLLPPVPPERGGQSTSDASSGSGDNHDANRPGPNTESIKSTNISDHSSTGISLNTESSQNTAEAGPSSGDHTNTSDAQSSLDNNHNTSDDVSSPPSPIPQQTNPNPREPSPNPTSIPLTPQQHPQQSSTTPPKTSLQQPPPPTFSPSQQSTPTSQLPLTSCSLDKQQQ